MMQIVVVMMIGIETDDDVSSSDDTVRKMRISKIRINMSCISIYIFIYIYILYYIILKSFIKNNNVY